MRWISLALSSPRIRHRQIGCRRRRQRRRRRGPENRRLLQPSSSAKKQTTENIIKIYYLTILKHQTC